MSTNDEDDSIIVKFLDNNVVYAASTLHGVNPILQFTGPIIIEGHCSSKLKTFLHTE